MFRILKHALSKALRSYNEAQLDRIREVIKEIRRREAEWATKSDACIKQQSRHWRQEVSAMDDWRQQVKRLREILPDGLALATVVCGRLIGREFEVMGQSALWNMVPFDSQLTAGIALHEGMVAEMATGEGKTLAAALCAFVNSLTGSGVHVVTTNDYLAKRDCEWMQPLYDSLGVTVGCIEPRQTMSDRRQHYAFDVTYCTASELAFDFLRDNSVATQASEQVQRGLPFAIIDEVDSILLDASRTPFILAQYDKVIGRIQNMRSQTYSEIQPWIERLVEVQNDLCKSLLDSAEGLVRERQRNSGDGVVSWVRPEAEEIEIGRLLFKAKLGSPHYPRLIKLLQTADYHRFFEQVEHDLYVDTRALLTMKEELFYTVNERRQEVELTQKGRDFISDGDPDAFTLPDLVTEWREIDSRQGLTPQERKRLKSELSLRQERISLRICAIQQMLKAYCVMQRDVDYVLYEGRVAIVSQNTGRLLTETRWMNGLHEAVQIKEGIHLPEHDAAIGSITTQNLFRRYQKLAGMTGTARDESAEFKSTYNMEVLTIPTRCPVRRRDLEDDVFATRDAKMAAIVSEILEVHSTERPILVGTASVKETEELSRLLERQGLSHRVLNAKHHQSEAEIVTKAGQPGVITIATAMAGRGTDIRLGPGVAERGGLHVIGTSRHTSRRVDDQLRGRCARQGDPGSSHFFLSFEDKLLRLFGSTLIAPILRKVGGGPDAVTRNRSLTRAIRHAQKRVETSHRESRHRTLEYDDVDERQRKLVYGFRNEIIQGSSANRLLEIVLDRVDEYFDEELRPHLGSDDSAIELMIKKINRHLSLSLTVGQIKANIRPDHENTAAVDVDRIKSSAHGLIKSAYQLARHRDAPFMRLFETQLLLAVLDEQWREHLSRLEALRHDTQLWANVYQPLTAYKLEAYREFLNLERRVKDRVCFLTFRLMRSDLYAKVLKILQPLGFQAN